MCNFIILWKNNLKPNGIYLSEDNPLTLQRLEVNCFKTRTFIQREQFEQKGMKP